MSLRRVGVLLWKDLAQGPKSFIFIWAVVAPIVISLVVSLAFGALFSEKPKLGIVDEGDSQLTAMALGLSSVAAREYATLPEMRDAVRRGAVDIGIVLPQGLDASLRGGERAAIIAYIWGESLAKSRTIVAVTIADLARELAGQEAPVEIQAIALGNAVSVPWNDRLFPLIVLGTVFVGGLFLPATSLITEKEKRTLTALVITPATLGDIFAAKGLVGIILSVFMGMVILALNQAFGAAPILLLLVLGLGSIMAVALGLLLGALIRDLTTLFTVWKLGSILLFGPAIVYMFPQIPEWVAQLFPTYYLIQPIVAVSQGSGGWPDIAANVFVLIGLDLLLLAAVALTLRRMPQHAV